jgi:GTP-binding protein Era
MGDPVTRSGFVALAGRPNAGKSTLVNAIVGEKVAIVSDKPQTTRRAIRGVATGKDFQVVLVDLPGVQRPRDALTTRMARRVERELADADAALVVLNGEQGVGGPGDHFIAETLAKARVPVTFAVNKMDKLDRGKAMAALTTAAELAAITGEDAEVFPVSALTGEGVDVLMAHLVSLLPPGPYLYDPSERSDLPGSVRVAELVREQVLRRTRQEVPHAVEVKVDDVERPRDGLAIIRATVVVETESQKGIVIGSGGKMIKAIGTAARPEVEALMGEHVHLELSVRVKHKWRGDDRQLDRLGID